MRKNFIEHLQEKNHVYQGLNSTVWSEIVSVRFLTIDISFNRNSHNESDFSKDANGVFHGLYQRACCDFVSEDNTIFH